MIEQQRQKRPKKWITTHKKRWNSTHNYVEAAARINYKTKWPNHRIRIEMKKKWTPKSEAHRKWENKKIRTQKKKKKLAVIKPKHFIAFFYDFISQNYTSCLVFGL